MDDCLVFSNLMYFLQSACGLLWARHEQWATYQALLQFSIGPDPPWEEGGGGGGGCGGGWVSGVLLYQQISQCTAKGPPCS